jgi:TonB family protein
LRKFTVLFAAALAASLPLLAAPKREAGNIAFPPAPYPEEARKNGIEGNVVVTGDITADGKAAGLRVLATSSPVLVEPALAHLRRSKFPPGKEDGKIVPLILNATVRFRDDRTRIADTGSMPAPIVGDLSVMPASADGKPTGPEGFAIGPSDAGVRGQLVVDVPKSSAGKTLHVVVTDRFPGGKALVVLDRRETPDPRGGIGVDIFRRVDSGKAEERGIHTLDVAVDGRPAGGARYRVGPGSPAASPSRKK